MRTSAALLLGAVLLAVWCVPARPAQNSGPARDRWQRPAEVMDALGVRAGSVVADIGCGRGYFTFQLAGRVGPQGRVYAEDIEDDHLGEIRDQAKEEGLTQIQTIHGTSDDPKLPDGSLDVVLVVNSYHEWLDYDSMLDHVFHALKPGGLFGLIDGEAEPGLSRDEYHAMHRMPETMERDDSTRHGFRFLRSQPGFTRTSDGKKFYFMIFEKPKS
jgi:predicted methyltransferase